MDVLAVVLAVATDQERQPWWQVLLPYVGTVLGLVFGLAASPLQERWARQREERAEDRAKTRRDEEAKAERQDQDREAAVALVARHRHEVRALLSSLAELARTIRQATATNYNGVYTTQVSQAMQDVEVRCWDLWLDCPVALADTTAATMTRARVIFTAVMRGQEDVRGEGAAMGYQTTVEAVDDLSREYGDACRAYFRDEDTGPRLAPVPPIPAPVIQIPPTPVDPA